MNTFVLQLINKMKHETPFIGIFTRILSFIKEQFPLYDNIQDQLLYHDFLFKFDFCTDYGREDGVYITIKHKDILSLRVYDIDRLPEILDICCYLLGDRSMMILLQNNFSIHL